MGRGLAGKVVLVTGAASGIGQATAHLFAAEGTRVVVVDIDEHGAEAVAVALRTDGGQASAFRADVARPADAEAMIAHAVATFGGLDVLDNNATSGGLGRVADMDVADWERVVAVNLTAPFLAAKHAIPVMRARGGGAIRWSCSSRPGTRPSSTGPRSWWTVAQRPPTRSI